MPAKTLRQMPVTAFRKNLASVLRSVTEAREELLIGTKNGLVRVSPVDVSSAPQHSVSAMATLFKDVGTRDWGYYSREDQRMHLQTVDGEFPDVKVWLEAKGQRIFEVEGEMLSKHKKELRAKVTAHRRGLEKRWLKFAHDQGWVKVQQQGFVLLVTMYPGTHNAYGVKLDMRKVVEPGIDINEVVVDWDKRAGMPTVGEPGADSADVEHVDLSTYLFSGPL